MDEEGNEDAVRAVEKRRRSLVILQKVCERMDTKEEFRKYAQVVSAASEVQRKEFGVSRDEQWVTQRMMEEFDVVVEDGPAGPVLNWGRSKRSWFVGFGRE